MSLAGGRPGSYVPPPVAMYAATGASYVAQPAQPVAMPYAQATYAAPGAYAQTYAAPQTPSYVAPPIQGVATYAAPGAYAQTYAAPAMPAAPQMPPTMDHPGAPPASITQGMPDPESIARQKEQYDQQLTGELEQATTAVQSGLQAQKDGIYKQAEQQRAQYMIQIEQQTREQEISLDEKMHKSIMALKQAAYEQKAQLEAQASQLILDFQQKKATEQFQQQQYELQRQFQDAQAELNQQQAALQQANPGFPGPQMPMPVPMQNNPSYVPPPVQAGVVQVASYTPPPQPYYQQAAPVQAAPVQYAQAPVQYASPAYY